MTVPLPFAEFIKHTLHCRKLTQFTEHIIQHSVVLTSGTLSHGQSHRPVTLMTTSPKPTKRTTALRGQEVDTAQAAQEEMSQRTSIFTVNRKLPLQR